MRAQDPADDRALSLQQLPYVLAASPARPQQIPTVGGSRFFFDLDGFDRLYFDLSRAIQLPELDRRELRRG